MTYIVDDHIRVMRCCRICGEGPDEDGYASCDCHKPRAYCSICEESVREDYLLEKISYDFQEIVFCEDCEELFHESQAEWWQQLAEDYHDCLYDIHQTIQELDSEQRFIPLEAENRIGDIDAPKE